MMDIFSAFAELLNERLSAGVDTTEDSVRYTFFHALTSRGNYKHTDVILEADHPTLANARIDTVIASRLDRPSSALEFKYDRSNPSGTNQPRTMKAGAVFNDLFRLASVPQSVAEKRYFIYLTDPEMASYFQNPTNSLAELFELRVEETYVLIPEFIQQRPSSFKSRIRISPVECFMVAQLNRELNQHHSLRIYEISTDK